MKTRSEKMALIHWYNRPAQVLPICEETLRWLLKQADSYEMIEEIEVLHFVQEAGKNAKD